MTVPEMKVPMKVHQSASAMDNVSQGARRATEDALSIAPPPDPEVASTLRYAVESTIIGSVARTHCCNYTRKR